MKSTQEIFTDVTASGKSAVIFDGGLGGKSFVGVVNEKIKVPRGEKGLYFIREYLKQNVLKNKQRKKEMPFTRGFAGFISYDLGLKWNGIKKRSHKAAYCPEAYFVFVDEVIPCSNAYRQTDRAGSAAVKSNLNYKKYFEKLSDIKKKLYSGDTYQVNFSQRFKLPFNGRAFEIYKRMSAINPSPFQFFMETRDFAIISNSPERLFAIREENVIETRPIKGTVPRGKTKKEERRNIKLLLGSEKEKAELEMIVDLERNDLGKICVPGTVKVTENRTLEKYSHVIHTVSNIKGILYKDCDWFDALKALFPGGSVTGCPKKRTMEIIESLEDFSRGIYCGSAGYIDVSGECDFNIMIRTLWLDKKKKQLCFNSGGGIIVDSDPRKEYEETLHKAAALMASISGGGKSSRT